MNTGAIQTHPVSVVTKSPLTSGKQRITSIDLLRGLVMVIMALDHVRDFFHVQGVTGDPTNLATTTPGLFFTRWITHFCAPAFVFLAGTSAYIAGQRKTTKELSSFLLKRGIWLVLIEVVVITLAWSFNPLYNVIILQVIWAIGMSMLVLGILVWLPFPVMMAIGILIVAGHNLLDTAEAARNNQVGLLWKILHTPGGFIFEPVSSNRGFLFIYAFPVWAGVMILGYGFGKFYQQHISSTYRKKLLLAIGFGAIALFIVLRLLNQYGDPSEWRYQKDNVFTFLSFLNTTKYPPSLLYLLMTLGPSIVFLALAEKAQSRFNQVLITYGRVPFFYYVLHLYLIHALCAIVFFASGYSGSDIVSPQSPFLFRPPDFGFSLWIVYGIWLLVVILLYPPCRWYDRYKSSHRQWWLSYL